MDIRRINSGTIKFYGINNKKYRKDFGVVIIGNKDSSWIDLKDRMEMFGEMGLSSMAISPRNIEDFSEERTKEFFQEFYLNYDIDNILVVIMGIFGTMWYSNFLCEHEFYEEELRKRVVLVAFDSSPFIPSYLGLSRFIINDGIYCSPGEQQSFFDKLLLYDFFRTFLAYPLFAFFLFFFYYFYCPETMKIFMETKNVIFSKTNEVPYLFVYGKNDLYVKEWEIKKTVKYLKKKRKNENVFVTSFSSGNYSNLMKKNMNNYKKCFEKFISNF